jgi:heat shock protein HslJ
MGSWSLLAFDLDSGQSVPVPDPSRYTLTLGTDLRANVRADCNVCNGNYTSSGSSLEFGLFACTLAACLPGSLEAPYMSALGSTSSYELTSGELRLRYEGGVLRFGPM